MEQEPTPTPVAPRYDWMGFVFTDMDAQRILGLLRLADVHDLVRAGELAALTIRENGKMVLRFLPDEITHYKTRVTMEQRNLNDRQTRRALGVVRDYLRRNPPVDAFEDAVERGLPVRATAKSDRVTVNVRAETIAVVHNARDEVVLGTEASVTTLAVERALQRMGAVKVKGFIALADKGYQEGRPKQRWERWWRLPRDLGLDGEKVPDVPELPPLVRDADEPVVRRGNVVAIDTPLMQRD